MPKFEITFKDEIEAEDLDDAIDDFILYLEQCARFRDVTVFNFFELKEKENA